VRFLLASVRARVSSFGRYCDDDDDAVVDEADAVDADVDDDDDALSPAAGVGTVDLDVVGVADVADVEGVAEVLGRLLFDAELTVESWSWMSIMWSPSRIVRFRGALPERKSTTCKYKTI